MGLAMFYTIQPAQQFGSVKVSGSCAFDSTGKFCPGSFVVQGTINGKRVGGMLYPQTAHETENGVEIHFWGNDRIVLEGAVEEFTSIGTSRDGKTYEIKYNGLANERITAMTLFGNEVRPTEV